MYTVEQRLKIYKRMLEESLSPSTVRYYKANRKTNESGLCFMYRLLTHVSPDFSGSEFDLYCRFKETLPELWAKRNSSASISTYMWEDWYEREEALARCIIELQEGGGIV